MRLLVFAAIAGIGPRSTSPMAWFYHASGVALGGHYWESIDVAASAIVTSQLFSGPQKCATS